MRISATSTPRVWLQMMPKLDLAEEFANFRREMEDVLAAAEADDLEAVGHIRRAHISMSFARMKRYAKQLGDPDRSEPKAAPAVRDPDIA